MDILCTIQDSHISTLVVTRAGIEPAAHSLATLHTSHFHVERTRTVVASCSNPLSYLVNLQVKESNLRLFAVAKHFKH
jgi:hypothetical protein